MNDVTITPTDNGPYMIHGRVILFDADGNPYRVDDTSALCRCGRSNSNPFCDGTHEPPPRPVVVQRRTGRLWP